jgi:purine-nucleoside phosphorylase
MVHPEEYVKKLPKEKNITCSEMEAFALFYTAQKLGKSAACLLTVVDSNCKKEVLTTEAREKSLNDMIKLALESALKL